MQLYVTIFGSKVNLFYFLTRSSPSIHFVQRQPTESQNVVLLREKVTLMDNVIKVLERSGSQDGSAQKEAEGRGAAAE